MSTQETLREVVTGKRWFIRCDVRDAIVRRDQEYMDLLKQINSLRETLKNAEKEIGEADRRADEAEAKLNEIQGILFRHADEKVMPF